MKPSCIILPPSAADNVGTVSRQLAARRPLSTIAKMVPRHHPLIRTVQELLGHRDVTTTMIYTHLLNRRPSGVHSPVDRLFNA